MSEGKNARDTQFQGFAKALWSEIAEEMAEATAYGREYSISDGTIEWIIARRAYDLSFHSVDYSLEYLDECGIKTSGDMGKRILPSIPDMTELPKEQEG